MFKMLLWGPTLMIIFLISFLIFIPTLATYYDRVGDEITKEMFCEPDSVKYSSSAPEIILKCNGQEYKSTDKALILKYINEKPAVIKTTLHKNGKVKLAE